jgi:hypothetical protein
MSSGPHILVVEGEEIVVALIQRTLLEQDYEVRGCGMKGKPP